MTHARSLLAWGAAIASATVLATTTMAASAQEGAASAGKASGSNASASAAGPQISPPNSAVQALNRGVEAYQKNNLARAIGAFSSAVSLGGLDSAGTAKALYYRGLAYRKQGRSAQAISDLTNALWLKNGLGDAERADATANRAAAYKEVGIADPGAPAVAAAEAPAASVPATTADEAAKPEPKHRAIAAAPPPAPAKPAPAPVAFANPTTTTVNTAAATPPQRVARAPIERADASPVTGESAPATQRAEAAPAPAASSGSGVGSFFSNLFGGSSSQQSSGGAAATSDVTTASTGNATSATSSWNSATEVAARQAAPRTPAPPTPMAAAPTPVSGSRTAALAPSRHATSDAAPAAPAGDAYSPSATTAPGAAPPIPANGRFKLQLAAVRSRADAESVAQRFASEQGAKAGGRNPVIEEAVFGNMGKFYRVNVGPFATAAEPDKLCQSLRASGYDCLIIGK